MAKASYRKARRIAKSIGCTIEKVMGWGTEYWVFGPRIVYGEKYNKDPAFREDPCMDCHCHANWDEVLDCVRDYLLDLGELAETLPQEVWKMFWEMLAGDRSSMNALADYISEYCTGNEDAIKLRNAIVMYGHLGGWSIPQGR